VRVLVGDDYAVCKGVTPDNMQHRPGPWPIPRRKGRNCVSIQWSLGRLGTGRGREHDPDWLVQVEKLSTQGKIKKISDT
jgi:hypothetical protein